MSDLFHEAVPDEAIDRIFAVIALCPQHLFIVLTKRPERLRGYFTFRLREVLIGQQAGVMHLRINGSPCFQWSGLPLSNVILGISAENQQAADERIPHLLATPAACRVVSAEPLLGPTDLRRICLVPKLPGSTRAGIHIDALAGRYVESGLPYQGEWDISGPPPSPDIAPTRLGWIIAGGESGPGARPMHPDWARGLRDQCQAAGVPFFFKQWGAWQSVYDRDREDPHWRRCDVVSEQTPRGRWLNLEGGHGFHGARVVRADKASKKTAGRLLDGREWNEWPEVVRHVCHR
jgi:protein gp37